MLCYAKLCTCGQKPLVQANLSHLWSFWQLQVRFRCDDQQKDVTENNNGGSSRGFSTLERCFHSSLYWLNWWQRSPIIRLLDVSPWWKCSTVAQPVFSSTCSGVSKGSYLLHPWRWIQSSSCHFFIMSWSHNVHLAWYASSRESRRSQLYWMPQRSDWRCILATHPSIERRTHPVVLYVSLRPFSHARE